MSEFDCSNYLSALPTPKVTGVAILRLLADDEYALGKLLEIVRTDPALTGRILSVANVSLHVGEPPATCIEDAALRLPVRSFRSLVLGFASDGVSVLPDSFSLEQYWHDSMALAIAARCLAGIGNHFSPSLAFTCALCSGIGRLALAMAHPDEYDAVISVGVGLPVSEFLRLERRELGVDHAQLAGMIFREWNLPLEMYSAVESFEIQAKRGRSLPENPPSLTTVLRGALRLTSPTSSPDLHAAEEVNSDKPDILARLGVTCLDYLKLQQTVAEEIEFCMRRLNAAGAAPEMSLAGAKTRFDINHVGRSSGLRILAVDGDPITLRLLNHHLGLDGHSITPASNPADALSIAVRDQPQLIITELFLPSMGGLGLCRLLRSSSVCADIYILVVTGFDEQSHIVSAFEAGADEFVSKPFNSDILRSRVRAGQRMIELRERVEKDKRLLNEQYSRMTLLNRHLTAAASTDVLTSLPNRRHALSQLDEAMKHALSGSIPLSVILLDVDHFKHVNDTHGHDAGDVVLQVVGGALRTIASQSVDVCRWGGEEFLVILPNHTMAAAVQLAEELRSGVQSLSVSLRDSVCSVTVSLGVASVDAEVANVADLIRSADQRVYAAKTRGRNCVVFRGGTDGVE